MRLAAVFQIGSLGDSVVSVPALLSIKELLPSCDEYVLVSRFDSTLKVLPAHIFDMAWKPKTQVNFQGPNKGLKEVLSIASLVRQIRHYRPHYCVYLMPSNRSPRQVQRDTLFFKAGGVKELIGFRTLSPEELTPGSTPSPKDTEAFLRFRRIWNESAGEKFARYSGPPLLKPGADAFQRVRSYLKEKRKRPEGKLLVLCPYSNSPSKDIPDSTSINLLRQLNASARADIVLLGGAKDFSKVQNLVQQSGAGINACGAFSVEESAALLSLSSLAICADSGPMHLAAAVGTPSVVAFSRMNKQLSQWLPIGNGHSILYRELDCAGCRAMNCPVEGHPCMRDITADQILSAAARNLSGEATAPDGLGSTKLMLWR